MSTNHYSQLYRQLRDVDPRDYQRIIRTYEERETEIGKLDVTEHFELTAYYADALFATGAYRQHQMMVDLVIEACMRHNIQKIDGIRGDAFQHLLFKKAASAYRLGNFDLAAHVARELIRMDPARELNVRFLRAALFRRQRNVLQTGRATFILFILLAGALVVGDILIVRSFYPEYTPLSQLAIGLSFLASVLSLLACYGFAYLKAHRSAYRFKRVAENKLL